ncbi:aminomethyl-transferring glycine dehydrogenase subunit GcvPB [Conexibacter sp. JD483]|uniref:aminomethyl-transferring glycine dehydrogenase subunit GcvPB n=1 Tax=unclassified Conexibacter TaxID=2627773 RepID=UPI002728EA95|nr:MULTISPECIES: aminomethyl-transferring glycine dehydrogenase subunit GcvPB [unclassified Conexibacter]MDO8185274.1 aminomethyl-transferring glycine dehydrogenase subunit GcvPB [Conexibacter sp. CPCC 205706]MDO8198320.1 aminomethyl-transferring glycine dehydrogenase subunit GcvPB [Conexibacter sp. CPCC 205762]MDR9367719.1 aminomethyl-transferring glycine dehydrogenase subunit GcvPB [Conexibacter sp. JD483]
MSFPRFQAAAWDEPLVLELGRPGRRAQLAPEVEDEVALPLADLLPAGVAREQAPALPELSEFEVQRHYLHLSQMTLGMMGVNLFGTCTMKYNARVNELIAARPELAEIHPGQPLQTLQGVLRIVHAFEQILCELSGMDRFVFQAGGGADAAYTHACVTRAYHAARGELEQRTEVITTIQTHPCNAATAAAAGFDVITLPLGPDGYPTLASLEAAVSDRTAALMVGNPDDMGIYNPEIKRWIELVHEAGGLAFYDNANFNGVMSRIRGRELGFDACMYMLHKTFGAPKGGGGPAVGAYGCSAELEPFLPRPLVTRDDATGSYGLETAAEAPQSIGKVREFWGNVPVVVKAYAWTRALGAEGIRDAADLSVLANNYMDTRLAQVRGVARSNPQVTQHRLEMTRWSLAQVLEETGVDVHDISNRMVDYGVDAPWLAHEPWLVPEPVTPEPGELWSKEDVDTWIDVLERVIEEAYADPDLVKTAPHSHPIAQVDASRVDAPSQWATTWRAAVRKGVVPGGPRGAAGAEAPA